VCLCMRAMCCSILQCVASLCVAVCCSGVSVYERTRASTEEGMREGGDVLCVGVRLCVRACVRPYLYVH